LLFLKKGKGKKKERKRRKSKGIRRMKRRPAFSGGKKKRERERKGEGRRNLFLVFFPLPKGGKRGGGGKNTI